MGSNFERGIFNQLQEVMTRLDAVEKDLKDEKTSTEKMSGNSIRALLFWKPKTQN